MSMLPMSYHAQKIGKKAMFLTSDLPWPVAVEIIDVRFVYGRLDYRIVEWGAREKAVHSTLLLAASTWVAAHRCRVVEGD